MLLMILNMKLSKPFPNRLSILCFFLNCDSKTSTSVLERHSLAIQTAQKINKDCQDTEMANKKVLKYFKIVHHFFIVQNKCGFISHQS